MFLFLFLLLSVHLCCFSFFVSCLQVVSQQQATITRPQVTLAQPPMVTLRGPTHSRIIVGQLQTGVCSTVTLFVLMFCEQSLKNRPFILSPSPSGLSSLLPPCGTVWYSHTGDAWWSILLCENLNSDLVLCVWLQRWSRRWLQGPKGYK